MGRGLTILLISFVTISPLLHLKALVLVYVTVALMVMVRQFSLLSSLDTDNKRLVVVTQRGDTEVDTVR